MWQRHLWFNNTVYIIFCVVNVFLKFISRYLFLDFKLNESHHLFVSTSRGTRLVAAASLTFTRSCHYKLDFIQLIKIG